MESTENHTSLTRFILIILSHLKKIQFMGKKNELQLFAVIGDRSEKHFRIILHLLTLKNTLLTIEKGP